MLVLNPPSYNNLAGGVIDSAPLLGSIPKATFKTYLDCQPTAPSIKMHSQSRTTVPFGSLLFFVYPRKGGVADRMNFGALFEGDDTPSNVGAHTLHSDPDIARFISDKSVSSSWDTAGDAQDVWERPKTPFSTSWSQSLADSYGFSFGVYSKQGRDIAVDGNQVPTQDIPDHSPTAAIRSPFSTDSGNAVIGPNDRLRGSPRSSQDDNQWKMYLSASLSNPFSSLAQSNPQGDLGFEYPMPHTPPSYLAHDPAFAASPLNSQAFPFRMDHNDIPSSTSAFLDSYDTTPGVDFSNGALHIRGGSAPTFGNNVTRLPAHGTRFLEASEISGNDDMYVSLAQVTDIASPHIRNHAPRFAVNGPLAQSTPSGSPDSTPSRGRSPILNKSLLYQATPSRARSHRGLAGWSSADDTDMQALEALSSKPGEPSPTTPLLSLKPPYHFSALSLDPTSRDVSPGIVVPLPKRSCRSSYSLETTFNDIHVSDDGQEDEDSDVYHPSRSPSFNSEIRENSPGAFQFSVGSSVISDGRIRGSRRGKGKAKGSAALALAVVTQMSKLSNSVVASPQEMEEDEDPEDDVYLATTRAGRKRKNNPIPLPVPVPHLIKKSRGRKVPYVAPAGGEAGGSAGEASNSGTGNEEEISTKPFRRSRGRKAATTAYSLGEGGKRTYMCEVAGCGKCFVRGEHLKRHVRSIHTYDKPHPCPYKGCDKSFSRRDNLGQHVRIHLQT